ncbi:MAG: PQQ-binding-like beta-propeller repeat protein [Bacteroidales bacterium]
MHNKKLHFIYTIILFAFIHTGCDHSEKKDIRFAFLTDMHFAEGNESAEQMREIISEINTSDLEFVVINGDISNQGSDSELQFAYEIFNELQIPYYIVPGNHETNWSESAGESFNKIFGDDKFSFVRDDFLFAGVNSGPFMRMGDGHIKNEDIQWIETTLTEYSEKKVIFFAHYPLAEGLDRWPEITDLLKEYDIQMAFCGHGHQLQLLNFNGIPGIMGRSRVLRGENEPGYNIVHLSSDSIFAFEKILHQPNPEKTLSFALKDPQTTLNIASSPLPDYSINEDYAFVKPSFAYRDSLSSVFTGPLVVGDSILIYGNSLGWIKALDIPSRKMIWETQLNGPLFSTPVDYNGLIILGDAEGILWALDASNGNTSWKIQTEEPVLATPLIHDGHVFTGSGSNAFLKIDARTGSIIWSFEEVKGLMQAKAAVHENYVVFTSWDTHVYCLDNETGTLLWKWNNDRPVSLLSPGNVVPVIQNEKVFIVAPDRKMTAIDLKTGNQVWRTGKHQVRESMGISYQDELIFAKLMNDSILAVKTQPDDFESAWVVDAGFGYDHNPCPLVQMNNTLFAATKNGVVMAINIQNQTLQWKYKVSNTAVNFFYPDNKTNKIWISTTDGIIMAFDN